MYIGLDVGGTHTDAVLLEAARPKPLHAVKVPTRPRDVLPGVLEALEKILQGSDPARVRRLSVSTTLGLNALLTGKASPVGMLALPGPGMDPRLFWGPDPLFHSLSGALDHRGRVIARPGGDEILRAFGRMAEQGARAIGIVCKFSPKNPELEKELAEMARKEFGPGMPVVTGASTGGTLNFPRRLHTVWCNAALAETSENFTRSLEKAVLGLGLACPVVVLKADAGVFSIALSAADPASGMGSGPAASLLGVWALSAGNRERTARDVLMIDMGGTTTDLALMADGYPLLAPEGLNVCGRPTLIRSLWTRSIALGGDSSLRLGSAGPTIGPDRSGPALALEEGPPPQRPPTLTDALNVLGLCELGNKSLSLAALEALTRTPGSPEKDPRALARLFVDTALERIRRESALLLADVNSRPVYTIRELLVEKKLEPASAVMIGGPAASLASLAGEALGLPVLVPEESAVANALGAALARPTRSADLYADTLLGRMSIPDFDVEKAIDRQYTLDIAEKDMREAFEQALETEGGGSGGGLDLQCVFAESFAMLDDGGRRGRTVRLRMQQAAGLLQMD